MEEKVNYNDVVDQIESVVADGIQTVCPLRHYFVNGLYCREIFMPADTVITSKVHNTEHPYVISMGKVAVIKEDTGVDLLEAPYFGVTYPNTRRVLHTIEDTVWTTFHRTDVVPESDSEEDVRKAVAKIEQMILLPYVNKVIENKKMEELK